jgi:Na+/H+ antiporter NhaD/arsenite permease-like protein
MPRASITDRRTWNVALLVLGGMIVLFVLQGRLHWDPWFIAVAGMTALLAICRRSPLEIAAARVEVALLMFFIGLFMVIGGVVQSGLLTWLGEAITPWVAGDLLSATLVLMWVAALLSAAIDNIPFTAAMIPVLLGMQAQGVNVTPLWWALSMGVGLGGNGTHIGATANVFVVTVSERLAREKGDPSLAITPALWLKKGTPAMLTSLVAATIVFVAFFEYFERPIR